MAQASDRLATYRILVTRILLTERVSLLDQPTQFPYDCGAWDAEVVGYIARVEWTSFQVTECNDRLDTYRVLITRILLTERFPLKLVDFDEGPQDGDAFLLELEHDQARSVPGQRPFRTASISDSVHFGQCLKCDGDHSFVVFSSAPYGLLRFQ